MPGFPDFGSAVKELAQVQQTTLKAADYEYQVTVPLSGELLILETHKKKFEGNLAFGAEFKKLLDQHDAEFNKNHRCAGAEARPGVQTKDKVPSRVKLEKDFESIEAFKQKHNGIPG